mmetsp:Transcript_39444/g.51636  ORF Transcript_39444/g.51636 Transcript_39444/m.51636 type:complete len:106 (-) Transcript_39444:32-349(-)
MLLQVALTWIGLCKLSKSMRFMVVLLAFLMVKSLSLIMEAILWLTIFESDLDGPGRLTMSACSEFVNWCSTQIIIWLVSMRFYSSTIPVKRIHLNLQAQEDAEAT